MSMRQITTLAAALVAGASFGAAMAVPASAAAAPHARSQSQSVPSARTFVCRDDGFGPTAIAAEDDAINNMEGDYVVASPIGLVSDVQDANGTWEAHVIANCTAFR
jgi:hypothetical protein